MAFAKVGKAGKVSALLEKLDATTYVIKGCGVLLKFSVAAGKTTFRFGRSTLILVVETTETGLITGYKILNNAADQLIQEINKGLDEFLPSPQLATVQINGKVYMGVDDLNGWDLKPLLNDAGNQINDNFGNYLAEIKKIGQDGLEESKLVIAKAIELDEFYKLLKEDLAEDLIQALEKLPWAQKKLLNVGLKNIDTKDWIKLNGVDGLQYWTALYKGGKTGGTNPVSAVANKVSALGAFKKLMTNHPELDINTIAKIKGHSDAAFDEVINDLDKMLSHSKKVENNITFDKETFDKLLTHWGNATSSQSKGVHGVMKAIQDPSYKDLFNGRKLEFEESVPNARQGEHNSNIDIRTDGQPPRRIEVKNYNGDKKISNATIKEQFIERDLFNATSLEEIIWIQTGTNKLTSQEFKLYLEQNVEALKNLEVEKISKLLNDETILLISRAEAAEKLISHLSESTNFNKIFK